MHGTIPENVSFRNSSGSFATLAAIRRDPPFKGMNLRQNPMNGPLMPLVCPICQISGAAASEYATAFRCVIHHNFKVADAVWRDTEECTREQWEIALRKARQSKDQNPGNGPLSEGTTSKQARATRQR